MGFQVQKPLEEKAVPRPPRTGGTAYLHSGPTVERLGISSTWANSEGVRTSSSVCRSGRWVGTPRSQDRRVP